MCVPDAHPRHILMQLRGGSQRGGQREKRGGLSGKAATTPTAAGGKKDVELMPESRKLSGCEAV